MKSLFISASVLFVLICLNANSQTVLFSEDFETSPVISFVNTWTDSVPDGPSPCGQASRGTTADFNSTNIDFQNAENSTYFLGVNPESPCGGFFDATLKSDTLDFSGVDSLTFTCRYFKSTTLNWGPTILQIEIESPSDTAIIETEFTENNTWDSIFVDLPADLISTDVIITIRMGGGEGVGIDDIEIIGYTDSVICPQPTNFEFSYSYISMGDWGVCEDSIVYGPTYCSFFSWNTPDTSLTAATLDYYIINIYDYTYFDTLIITTTTDNIFEIEQGFMGEMWVTAVYSDPYCESNPSNIEINTDLPISVNETQLDNGINVFYNNNSNQLIFENAENMQAYYLYDISGKIIVLGKNTTSSIDLKDLSNGMYTINIISNTGEKFVKKIIIQ